MSPGAPTTQSPSLFCTIKHPGRERLLCRQPHGPACSHQGESRCPPMSGQLRLLVSGLDKWICYPHAQAWKPEHTVGGLPSLTAIATSTVGSLGLQAPRNQAGEPWVHKGLLRVLMGEGSLLLQERSRERREPRTAAEPTQTLHPLTTFTWLPRPLRLQAGGREGGQNLTGRQSQTNLPPAAAETCEGLCPASGKTAPQVWSPGTRGPGPHCGRRRQNEDEDAAQPWLLGKPSARVSAPAARTAPAGPCPRSASGKSLSRRPSRPADSRPGPYAAWRLRLAGLLPSAPAGPAPPHARRRRSPPALRAAPARPPPPSLSLRPPAPSSQPCGQPLPRSAGK